MAESFSAFVHLKQFCGSAENSNILAVSITALDHPLCAEFRPEGKLDHTQVNSFSKLVFIELFWVLFTEFLRNDTFSHKQIRFQRE